MIKVTGDDLEWVTTRPALVYNGGAPVALTNSDVAVAWEYLISKFFKHPSIHPQEGQMATMPPPPKTEIISIFPVSVIVSLWNVVDEDEVLISRNVGCRAHLGLAWTMSDLIDEIFDYHFRPETFSYPETMPFETVLEFHLHRLINMKLSIAIGGDFEALGGTDEITLGHHGLHFEYIDQGSKIKRIGTAIPSDLDYCIRNNRDFREFAFYDGLFDPKQPLESNHVHPYIFTVSERTMGFRSYVRYRENQMMNWWLPLQYLSKKKEGDDLV